jgi:hypothetical protein
MRHRESVSSATVIIDTNQSKPMTTSRFLRARVIGATLGLTAAATSARPATAQSTTDGAMATCLSITVDAGRLACYDSLAKMISTTNSATTPPPANVPLAMPVITSVSPASPSNNVTPMVSGNAKGLATVRLYSTYNCSGTLLATATASSMGTFSMSVRVAANAVTTLYAMAQDATGTSPCSAGVVYTTDTTAPAAPIFAGTQPLSPSTNTRPMILGTAEPNARVMLYANPTCFGTPAAFGSSIGGNFNVSASVLAHSTTTFYARATDAAGNASVCSTTSITYVSP